MDNNNGCCSGVLVVVITSTLWSPNGDQVVEVERNRKQETGSFQELHFGISCKYLKYVNGKQQTRIIIKYSAVPELHPSSSSSSRIIIKYSAIECGKVKPTNKKVALSEKCSCFLIYIIKENNYTDRLCNITYVGISENFLNYVKANTFSASGTIFDSYLIFVFFFTF